MDLSSAILLRWDGRIERPSPMSLSPELTAAIATLKQKSCIETPQIDSESERETLRQSIKLACQEADWENIGICADNTTIALQTVRDYLQALGYGDNPTMETTTEHPGAVYLKFNTQKMSAYLDDYEGKYRGVLIALQSPEEELLGTYGHFPLDLFSQ